MQLYAVELLAFSAIPICIVRSSDISGTNITQGNVSAGAPPSVDYQSGDPFQHLLEPDETPYSEERMPSGVSDEVNKLVSRALTLFKPSSWINPNVAFPVIESDKTALAKHVQGMIDGGAAHLQQIEGKLKDPVTAQKTVNDWIAAVHLPIMKSHERGYTTKSRDWLRLKFTPLVVFRLLRIALVIHDNVLVTRNVEGLERYIEMYNKKFHTHHSLLETLKDGYDETLKMDNDGKLKKVDPSMKLKKGNDVEPVGLSTGQAKLAIDLSIAKLSILSMQKATELQKELLNSWIVNGITVDDVFKTVNGIVRGRSRENFAEHRYLDTFLEFVELQNENPLLEKTDAITFLKTNLDKFDLSVAQDKKKTSAYITQHLSKLSESRKAAKEPSGLSSGLQKKAKHDRTVRGVGKKVLADATLSPHQ